jgi:hypothetical protein
MHKQDENALEVLPSFIRRHVKIKKNNKNIKDLYTQFYRYSTILKVCHRRFRHEGCVGLDFLSLTANILHPSSEIRI